MGDISQKIELTDEMREQFQESAPAASYDQIPQKPISLARSKSESYAAKVDQGASLSEATQKKIEEAESLSSELGAKDDKKLTKEMREQFPKPVRSKSESYAAEVDLGASLSKATQQKIEEAESLPSKLGANDADTLKDIKDTMKQYTSTQQHTSIPQSLGQQQEGPNR